MNTLRASALCLAGCLPLLWSARPDAAPAAAPLNDLEESMHAAESALDALIAAVDARGKATEPPAQAEQVAAARAAVDQFQNAMYSAFSQTPKLPRSIEAEADKLVFGINFQRKILATLDTSLGLELALIAGDFAAVQTALAALLEAEQSGHREFRPKRERRGPGGPPREGGEGGG